MEYTANSIQLATDGMDIYLGFVDKEERKFHTLNLNIDQVVLLLKQSAEIISRCSIVRPIP